MKEERNIDDLFRSSFEDFEIAPPASVKAAIDEKIAEKRSSRKFWWFFFALLFLISAGIASAFYFGRSGMADNRPVAMGSNTGSASTHTSAPASAHTKKAASASITKNAADSVTHRSGTVSSEKSPTAKKAAGTSTVKAGKNTSSAGTNGASSAVSGKSSKAKKTAKQPNGKTTKTGKKTGEKSKKQPSAGKKSAGDASKTQPDPALLVPKQLDPEVNPLLVNTPPAINPETAKQDSILAAVKLQEKKDSTERANDSSFKEPGNKPAPKPAPPSDNQWMASIYAGPQFGFNKTSALNFSEKPAFQFSGEINRSIFAGYGLTTGLNYATQRKESQDFNSFSVETYYTLDSTPIFNQNGDSIIGYLYTDVLHHDTTKVSFNQVNLVSSFGFPLYINKHFMLGETWGILVNAGAQFNFYKITLGQSVDSLPKPVTNDFSINIVGRIHATYKWRSWLFSAGLAGGYDLKPAIIYEERKRYYLTPQIGIHFTF